MSDFAFQYFNSELDNLELPELTQILEKVTMLISEKTDRKTAAFSRELGGYEDGFYIAADFDEPPDCFKEYM